MCGICGFNWDDKKLIKLMTNTIKHRGPDDKGHYTDKNVSLGHRRLSIIDLSKNGKNPLPNENSDSFIIFNGEIYNFQEIKNNLTKHKFRSNTDTEVILHAYEEYGEECLKKFNGMFAFCIYDSKKKILFIARDRLGIKPLYYYKNKDKFIFASEIKCILQNNEIKREINKQSLNKFISLRYVPGEETIFNNINRLSSGHYLKYDLKTNKLTIKKYWDLKIDNNARGFNEEYYSKNTYELLKDSVKKRLISDVPLGAYLSGGIDSSAIVALMHKINQETNNTEEIKTFSVGFEQGDYVNELPYAKQVSELFNTNHKEIFIKPDVIKVLPEIIWHLDEPMADPALIPVLLLSKQAKKDVTVVLTGDGGDETFAGYDQYRFLKWGNTLKHIPLSHNTSKIMKLTPNFILDRLYKHSSRMGKDSFKKVDLMIKAFKNNNQSKAYYELLSLINDDERKSLLTEENYTDINYTDLNNEYFRTKQDFTNQLLHFDTKNLLSESFLMKTDRMTMAHAIEARVPFLDHRLVQFAYNTPSNLKLKNNITKYVLKKSLSKILPHNILHRKKQTFHVPIEQWLKNDLKPFFDSMLDEKEINKLNLFNYSQINKIFKNYNKGELFYARQAWNLICFKIWHDRFIL